VLVALYPLPATFGCPLPKLGDPWQILIDRITGPYFQFFALAIPITMLLPDSTIASFRLKDGYKQAISNIRLWIAPAFFAVFFVVVSVELASHYIFNIRDSFGAFCKPSPAARELEICRPKELSACKADAANCTPACRGVETEFDTRDVCVSTGVKVVRDRATRYAFQISKKGDWSFLGAASGPGGMPVTSFLPGEDAGLWDSAVALGRAALLTAAYPIKRTFDRPFGNVILRYGQTGNEENLVDPDPDDNPAKVTHLEETFRPTRAGELFIYLNKPVSGFFPDLFNDVNRGTAKIRIYRVPADVQP